MQLENMMNSYQPRVSEIRQQTYFVVGDLESLSASALYYGEGGGSSGGFSGSFGGMSKEECEKYNLVGGFGDGTTLRNTTLGKIQISDNKTDCPLMRMDRADAFHPKDHIDYGGFGNKFSPERTGKEARDLIDHTILKKLEIDLGK